MKYLVNRCKQTGRILFRTPETTSRRPRPQRVSGIFMRREDVTRWNKNKQPNTPRATRTQTCARTSSHTDAHTFPQVVLCICMCEKLVQLISVAFTVRPLCAYKFSPFNASSVEILWWNPVRGWFVFFDENQIPLRHLRPWFRSSFVFYSLQRKHFRNKNNNAECRIVKIFLLMWNERAVSLWKSQYKSVWVVQILIAECTSSKMAERLCQNEISQTKCIPIFRGICPTVHISDEQKNIC